VRSSFVLKRNGSKRCAIDCKYGREGSGEQRCVLTLRTGCESRAGWTRSAGRLSEPQAEHPSITD
jgi:hypothetical protein